MNSAAPPSPLPPGHRSEVGRLLSFGLFPVGLTSGDAFLRTPLRDSESPPPARGWGGGAAFPIVPCDPAGAELFGK